MKSKEFAQAMKGIPMLAKIWSEDDVWNVSAFDIPVVAYGKTIDEARENFEEALECHLRALRHFNELDAVVADLRTKAAQRGFYENRVQQKTLVEDFAQPTDNSFELCSA